METVTSSSFNSILTVTIKVPDVEENIRVDSRRVYSNRPKINSHRAESVKYAMLRMKGIFNVM